MVVMAAISEVASAEDDCRISSGLNSDYFRYGISPPKHALADETIMTVVIECVVSDDVDSPDWERWGVWFDLFVRYPLMTGSHATLVNDQVRSDVAGMISEYLANARERLRSGSDRGLIGVPDDSVHRAGELNVEGYVSLMTDGLYSVSLQSYAHDPDSNTSQDYLRTVNYDLATGERFYLTGLLHPGSDPHLAPLKLAKADSRWADVSWTEDAWDDLNPEDLKEQDFVLTSEAIVLQCAWCCSEGISPGILDKGHESEISYEDLVGYLDPDGPYRRLSSGSGGIGP